MLNSNAAKIKTYVGSDGKIHFVNSVGADTVLNFSSASKLLWYQEAKGDSSVFPAQTITLNELVNYDGAIIKCVLQNVTGWMNAYYYGNLKGQSVQAFCSDNGSSFYRRIITINDNSVTFADGTVYNPYYTSGFAQNNYAMYPIAIYGYNE